MVLPVLVNDLSVGTCHSGLIQLYVVSGRETDHYVIRYQRNLVPLAVALNDAEITLPRRAGGFLHGRFRNRLIATRIITAESGRSLSVTRRLLQIRGREILERLGIKGRQFIFILGIISRRDFCLLEIRVLRIEILKFPFLYILFDGLRPRYRLVRLGRGNNLDTNDAAKVIDLIEPIKPLHMLE